MRMVRIDTEVTMTTKEEGGGWAPSDKRTARLQHRCRPHPYDAYVLLLCVFFDVFFSPDQVT